MNIDAVTAFVANVRVHFNPDQMTAEQESTWVKSLARSVGKFPPDVIKAAAQHIIKTRKYKTFPLPADIIDACQSIEKSKLATELSKTLPQLKVVDETWTAERLRAAYELCRSDLGRKAAREGWALRLWNFYRVELRNPSPIEMSRLSREAQEHRQLVASLTEPALRKLGQQMLDRADRLTSDILQ